MFSLWKSLNYFISNMKVIADLKIGNTNTILLINKSSVGMFLYQRHRIREGELRLSVLPCIMAPSAMEQKIGGVWVVA